MNEIENENKVTFSLSFFFLLYCDCDHSLFFILTIVIIITLLITIMIISTFVSVFIIL